MSLLKSVPVSSAGVLPSAIRREAMSTSLYHGYLRQNALRASRTPSLKRRFVTVIKQGREGWRLSLGRNPVKLTPGLRINIPIYHTLKMIDLREGSINIPNLPGYTKDNVPVLASGSLFYKITDGYKACFQVSGVHDNVRNIGTSAVRSVLGSFTYDQVIGDRNELNKRLNIVIGNSIQSWGVSCTRFEIQTFQPANREVERQLELQMEAERNRRKQLLDTEAQINIAEGHKQRVILESEGSLQARANEAEANFKIVTREAEARQKQAVLEATALSEQVNKIATSLSDGETEATVADKRLALSTLVELRRLEQLRAIAASKNNSTYFFGDKSALGEGYNVDYAEQVKSGLAKTHPPAKRSPVPIVPGALAVPAA